MRSTARTLAVLALLAASGPGCIWHSVHPETHIRYSIGGEEQTALTARAWQLDQERARLRIMLERVYTNEIVETTQVRRDVRYHARFHAFPDGSEAREWSWSVPLYYLIPLVGQMYLLSDLGAVVGSGPRALVRGWRDGRRSPAEQRLVIHERRATPRDAAEVVVELPAVGALRAARGPDGAAAVGGDDLRAAVFASLAAGQEALHLRIWEADRPAHRADERFAIPLEQQVALVSGPLAHSPREQRALLASLLAQCPPDAMAVREILYTKVDALRRSAGD